MPSWKPSLPGRGLTTRPAPAVVRPDAESRTTPERTTPRRTTPERTTPAAPADSRAHDEPHKTMWPSRRSRPQPRARRASDVLRLLVALAVLVGAGLLAGLARVSVRVTERALLESIITLPAALRDSMRALAQVAAVLLPVGFIAALASGKRFSLTARALLAALAGTSAGVVVSHVFLAPSHPATWAGATGGERRSVRRQVPARGLAFQAPSPCSPW